MSRRTVGIVMNGVTGRMGRNQHLERSILAIRRQGGLDLGDGNVLWPEPTLVGRSEARLRSLAASLGVERWTTALAAALADPAHEIYFDAQITSARVPAVKSRDRGGPARLLREADRGDAHGRARPRPPRRRRGREGRRRAGQAVPAGAAEARARDRRGHPRPHPQGAGRLRLLGLRGHWQPAQRPSRNFRAEDGGIIVDMLPHWRYVLDHLFGEVRAVSCLGVTLIPERWDEAGRRYDATADDAAYAAFLLEGGAIAKIDSSWATRVYRDDLVTFPVDGTDGSAVAGLRDCRVQHRTMTPRPVWNPDIAGGTDFRGGWAEVADNGSFDNAFKAQWELFLRHVVQDAPYRHTLLEGAKGVQLAELGLLSSREARWVEVPELTP